MTEPRRIAVVRNYQEFMDALRARADELGMTRLDIDDRAGLQDGYASKLLAPVPIKSVGPVSLGPVLGAMGLMIVVVEDAEALARIRVNSKKRRDAHDPMLTPKSKKRRGYWNGDKEWGSIMHARSVLKTPPWRRRQIARKAARIRWAKQKQEDAK